MHVKTKQPQQQQQQQEQNMDKNGELNSGKCYVRVNHTRYL